MSPKGIQWLFKISIAVLNPNQWSLNTQNSRRVLFKEKENQPHTQGWNTHFIENRLSPLLHLYAPTRSTCSSHPAIDRLEVNPSEFCSIHQWFIRNIPKMATAKQPNLWIPTTLEKFCRSFEVPQVPSHVALVHPSVRLLVPDTAPEGDDHFVLSYMRKFQIHEYCG